jgi:polyisoprenoid-binding protein YceI
MTATRCVLLSAALWLGPAREAAQVGGGGGRDSVVYLVTPASRFEVKTGKAGLLGFAGHGHLVRARAASGRIVYFPNGPADSRVEVVVPVDSLEVLTPPDTAEIRKVTEAMRHEVLHPDRYPLISFVSTAVTPADSGLEVRGRLTIEGQTRDVTVVIGLQIAGDTLRASGRFSVKQTEFGIKPYRGGPAGTVRVADRVEFNLAILAVRSADP